MEVFGLKKTCKSQGKVGIANEKSYRLQFIMNSEIQITRLSHVREKSEKVWFSRPTFLHINNTFNHCRFWKCNLQTPVGISQSATLHFFTLAIAITQNRPTPPPKKASVQLANQRSHPTDCTCANLIAFFIPLFGIITPRYPTSVAIISKLQQWCSAAFEDGSGQDETTILWHEAPGR